MNDEVKDMNRVRAALDKIVAELGIDDPLTPWNIIEHQHLYTNWMEFARVVCEPIVMDDVSPEDVQIALARFRAQCPHYIAAALVFAVNKVERLTSALRSSEEQFYAHMSGSDSVTPQISEYVSTHIDLADDDA